MLKKLQENPYRLTVVLFIAIPLKSILLILASSKTINPDGLLYFAIARQIAEGNISQALKLFQMPLYPAIIALFHFFVPNWTLAGRLVSASSLVLINIPLFWVTRELFSKKAAFWACLAFTVAPMSNEWSVTIIRGPLFLLLLSYAVYFALRSMRVPKTAYFAAVLFFSVASVLCRLEGVVFIGFYIICLTFWVIRYPQSRGHYVKGLLLWGGFFVSIIAVTFLIRETIDITKINRFGHLVIFVQPVIQLSFLDRYNQIYTFLKTLEGTGPFYGYGKGFLETSQHYLFLIYIISLLETMIKVIWPLFCIPLFWSRKCQKTSMFWFVCGVAIAYFISTYLFLIMHDFIASRYIWASAFFLYPMIGFGFTKIIDRIEATRHSKIWFVVLLIVFFIPPTVKSVGSFTNNNTSIIEAGQWLASQNFPESATIATMEPRVLYYAGWDIFSNTYLSKQADNRFQFIENNNATQKIHDYKPDIIILKRSSKNKGMTIEAECYQKIKSFGDRKGSVDIYSIDIYYAARFVESRKRGPSDGKSYPCSQ